MTILRGATAGSLWAFCLLGAVSIATKSFNGGNILGFFACCGLAPSADRFSAADMLFRSEMLKPGMAEILF